MPFDGVIAGHIQKLRDMLDNPDTDWTDQALRTGTITFFKSFVQFAPQQLREELSSALMKRLGITATDFAFILGCTDEALIEEVLSKQQNDGVFPTKGWLGDYIRFTNGHESPAIFHFWNGVSVIGASLSRRVYFEKSYYRVYPNHYVVLVAPTGKCKKSTGLNIAVSILRDANVIEILSEKGTPEGILELMATQVTAKQKVGGGAIIKSNPALFIHAPELGVFLGKQEFNEGLILLLTTVADARDGPFDYSTRTKGKLTLNSPTLHLLGGITPDGLAHAIPQSAFLGGSISRVLFIVQQDTPRIFGLPRPVDDTLRMLLQTKLVRFSGITAKASMTPAAEKWYEEWYHSLRKEQHDIMHLSGYFARKPDHLIRLALVTSVSEEDTLEMDENRLQSALKILDHTQKFMPEAFTIVDTTEQGRHYEAVVEVIQRAGGRIEHSALLKRVYRYGVNADMLTQRIVPTLEQAGMIKHIMDASKRTNFYILVKR